MDIYGGKRGWEIPSARRRADQHSFVKQAVRIVGHSRNGKKRLLLQTLHLLAECKARGVQAKKSKTERHRRFSA
jgi:hypothetical protein